MTQLTEVMAAAAWPTNAHLIEDIAQFWLPPEARVVDLTYGKGVWWKRYRPQHLVTNDIDPAKGEFHHDYTKLPDEWAEQFDVVAFDPPYVSTSSGREGREKTTIPEFYEGYGLMDAARTPRALHEYNMLGLIEAKWVCRKGGIILVKCQPYTSSGKYHPVDEWVRDGAHDLGLAIECKLIHVGKLRPQPTEGRVARRPRNNYSVMFVFRKGRK